MSTYKEQTVVDLRGVRTSSQKRLERLRNEAREPQQRRSESHNNQRPKKYWNNVFGGVARIATIGMVIASSWVYLPNIASSLSYFTDTEGAFSNMTTGTLDLIISSVSDVVELSCGGMGGAEMGIQTMGNLAFVGASTTGMTGDVALCEAIELDVRHMSETVYSGPLLGFYTDNLVDGDIRFIFSLDENAGPFPEHAMCTTSIEYLAMQQRHGGEWGFSDTETVELAFSVDTTSCESCNKSCTTCGDAFVDVTNVNDATVITGIDVSTNTGGNNADGGGTVVTGQATADVDVEHEVNVNETTIDIGCCDTECSEGCDAVDVSCTDQHPCTEDNTSQEVEVILIEEDTADTEKASQEVDTVHEEENPTTEDMTPEELAEYIQGQFDTALEKQGIQFP